MHYLTRQSSGIKPINYKLVLLYKMSSAAVFNLEFNFNSIDIGVFLTIK